VHHVIGLVLLTRPTLSSTRLHFRTCIVASLLTILRYCRYLVILESEGPCCTNRDKEVATTQLLLSYNRTIASAYIISMQGPSTPTLTEDVEASIPTEHAVRNGPHLSAGNRKAAKRTFPWELAADEIQLALPRLQDEDDYTRETKRPRLEEPVPTSTDEATTEKTSHDTTVALLPPEAAAAAADRDDSDPVTNMHPNVMTTGTSRPWTPEEIAKLTSAVTNTPKKKWGKKYKPDWVAISAQVPGRTRKQCIYKWRSTLDSSIDRAIGRTGKWKEDEDTKLKNAVHKHGGKDWAAIAALVPGRTRTQCHCRWQENLNPSRIKPANGRTGKWTPDEDTKLKNAVRAHGAKNWKNIATFVPGRTKKQCCNRWYDSFASIIDTTAARTGRWEEDEDIRLKDAVRARGAKNWEKIAALVPGRTGRQCGRRWREHLDRSTAGEEEHDTVNKASAL
jgi:hypothetical protein